MEDKFELAKNKLLEIEKLLEDVDEGVGHRETTQKSNYVIKVHPLKKSKTKRNDKRWKSEKEIAIEHAVKRGLCHNYNKWGVKHNKRTCPFILGHQ